jgi:Flp pilus assembly protein TadG
VNRLDRLTVGDERGGGPAVEAALLAVLFGLVIALAIAGGRLVAAESAIDQAARAAARIASIQRDGVQAQQRARAAAQDTLSAQGLACTQLAVTVDTSRFARPLGEAGAVRAEVACAVRWSDLTLPAAPGTRLVEASFTSAIDRFKETG